MRIVHSPSLVLLPCRSGVGEMRESVFERKRW
jgi:hypothetical protein